MGGTSNMIRWPSPKTVMSGDLDVFSSLDQVDHA